MIHHVSLVALRIEHSDRHVKYARIVNGHERLEFLARQRVLETLTTATKLSCICWHALVPFCLSRLGQFLGFGDGLFDSPDHIERLLRQMVVVSGAQTFEPLDCVLNGYELARRAGKYFSHV